jgi:hypothetical protein
MSRISKTKRRTQYIHKKSLSFILIFCMMLGSFSFGPGTGTVYASDISASMLPISWRRSRRMESQFP